MSFLDQSQDETYTFSNISQEKTYTFYDIVSKI